MVKRGSRKHAAGNDHQSDQDDVTSEYEYPSSIANVVRSLDQIVHPLPKLFVFDLDYTLWPLWVDTHVDGPLKRRGNEINKVHDRYNQPLSFFPHVPHILFHLKRKGTKVAIASRTSAPTVAKQALNGLHLIDDSHLLPQPSKSSSSDQELDHNSNPHPKSTSKQPKIVKAMSFFDYHEIYPGSKITHFRQLQKSSGVDYQDMIFFDDEHRNAEVGTKLGVHFVLVGHQGTDLATFQKGVTEWQAKRLARLKANPASKEQGQDADSDASIDSDA